MKKNKIIKIYLLLLSFFVIKISNVDAAISIGPSPTGSPATCSGNNCYSLGTAGMRVAIIDSKGNVKGNIVDYWFFNDEKDEFYFPAYNSTLSKPYVYYGEKRLKQQIVNAVNKYGKPIPDNIPKAKKTYTIDGKTTFTMKNFTGLLKNNGFTSEFSGGVYVKSAAALNVRHPNAAYTIVKKIIYDKRATATGKKYMQQIFTDTKSGFVIGEKVPGNLYLQFEPLISWQNRFAPGLGNGSVTFFGTITEFSRLMYDSLRIKKDCAWSYTEAIAGSGGTFTSASCNNPWGIVHSGVIADSKNAIPKNSKGNYIFNSVSSDCSARASSCYSKVLSYDGYGVGFISLNPYKVEEGCEELVKNNRISGSTISTYVSNLKTKLGDKWLTSYNWMTQTDSNGKLLMKSYYGIDSLAKLKNHLEKSCGAPTCQQSYNYFNDKSIFKNNLINTTIYDTESAVKNARNKVKKGDAKWNLDLTEYVKITNNACEATSCGTLLGDLKNKAFSKLKQSEKNKINYLFNKFPGNKYLSLEILEELDEKPKCEDINECEPSVSGNGYCSSKVVFKDSTKWDGCLKEGIAYSTSGFAGSKDFNYSGGTCNVFCLETVTLNLPSNPNEIKAGRILKWGGNQNDNVLGTMTVNRECRVPISNPSGGMCTSNVLNIGVWAKKIDTTIKLHYKEPVSGTNLTSNITAQLKEAGVRAPGISPQVVSGPNYKYSCGKNCYAKLGLNTQYSFVVYANYEFNYGNDLKWYSSKEDEDNIMTYKSSFTSDENKNYYVFIGYGLPTYFSTPNVTHSIKQGSDGYYWNNTKSSSKGTGYLYMDIDKIGSKTSTSKSHFDNYIISKSGKNANDGFQDNVFKYACDYSVKNEITGTECIGKSPNKPSYCKPDDSPKGIDVVFRTVELINNNASKAEKDNQITRAFPGRSGNGRAIGRNWATLGSTEEQNKVEIAKILRNTIYTEKSEPMYKISLGPAEISNIRNDNLKMRNSGHDPFTYIQKGKVGGVSDSGYNCVKKSGAKFAYCASTFVRNKMDGRCGKKRNSPSKLQQPCE